MTAHTAVARGLNIVAVIGADLTPAQGAVRMVGRLADEFPPRRVHLLCLAEPVWLRALGMDLDPTVIGDYRSWSEGARPAPWRSPEPPEEAAAPLAFLGCSVTLAWSHASWRATLRRARNRRDVDLILAVSGRQRLLPRRRKGPRVEGVWLHTEPRHARPAGA